MNFFEHQDLARRNTRRLVILMLLAVASLIVVTTVLVAVVLYYFQYDPTAPASGNLVSQSLSALSWELLGYITLGIGTVVLLGSLFKLLQLSAGGRTVAEAMGGRLINLDTRDANERKILNVVEEMAIASGTSVPPVYILEDSSINAFAAGKSPQDAVIGITRGCIELLSRDELQGVVAHEFSHILHGDMRLNIRLVGILHGILLLGLIGYYLLRSAHLGGSSSRRRSDGNAGLVMVVLGLGLMIVGYAGTFFGNIIKAAVSRQREFLADSSAVQFTRNPDGIAGALKKIGAHSQGSLLGNAHAAEFSHMFFGQGIHTRFNALMATHPPLPERIRRIQPHWDGSFPTLVRPATAVAQSSGAQSQQVAGFAAAAAGSVSAIESIGQPSPEHVVQARALLQSIPDNLSEAAHEPLSARALVYSLLISKSVESIAEHQWRRLAELADPAVFQATESLHPTVLKLERDLNLPLLELCIPTLKQLAPREYKKFKTILVDLIRADQKVDVFEWCLYRITVHNLEPRKTGASGLSLKQLADECRLLIAFIAHSGHDSAAAAQSAFDAGFNSLGLGPRFFMARGSIQLPDLDAALNRLKNLKPLQKPVLLKALARCINHDATITVTERELFRSVADSLDCPVPPLLPGQSLD